MGAEIMALQGSSNTICPGLKEKGIEIQLSNGQNSQIK